ncbi:MAG TPA: hypothetical protein DD639_01575, partial [Acinetobacter sp.]|nr:hypothetical protein [Acinetobacter sp.]
MTNLKDLHMLPNDQWVDVCHLSDITPNTGVGALIEGQSVALFRVGNENRIY